MYFTDYVLTAMSKIICLVYVSAATSWPTEQDLIRLLKQARAENEKRNVTGMLIYNNGVYMQLLEGSAKDVHEVYQTIQKDPRHNRIITIFEEPMARRYFPDWSMGFKNLSTCSPEEIPGFKDVFNGKLDIDIASKNKSVAVDLITNFAKLKM